MGNTQDFYSIKEFAKKLRVHQNTIRRMIKCARIHAFRLSSNKKSCYRIPHSEIGRIATVDFDNVISDMIENKRK